MTQEIKNIEISFLDLELKPNLFPHSKDYISLYKLIKNKFDTTVHPEIKSKILEIEQEGYYNDHGIDHIKMVIDRATWLLRTFNTTIVDAADANYISPYEIFLLLTAINLHDAGHLIASRSDHAAAAKTLLAKFDGGLLSTAERRYIGDIAKAHGGKDDPISKLPMVENSSHFKIRPQLLSSILRLADELAEDTTRASNFLLDLGKVEKTSEIFHRYSAALDSIEVAGGEIKLSFFIHKNLMIRQFPKKNRDTEYEVYLLDEIYARTFKTFTEALYCSRFFPERGRINCVKVNVNILDDDDADVKIISYELKEKGYPSFDKDIYDLCDTLHEGGQKIDGDYLMNLLKN